MIANRSPRRMRVEKSFSTVRSPQALLRPRASTTRRPEAPPASIPSETADAEDRSPCAFCLRSSSSRYLRPSLRARRAVTPRSIHRVSRSIALSSRRAVSASACRILSDHSSKAAKPWSSRRTRRPANQKQVPVSRSRNARS